MSNHISPQQCRAARSMLGIHQQPLCDKAGVTIKTLSDFESGKTSPHADTLDKLRSALEKAGVEFIPADNGGPGVRLRKAGK